MQNVYFLNFKVNSYQNKLNQMSKTELLDEMIAFQEERSKIGLNNTLLSQGLILFDLISQYAETPALKKLSKDYLNKLKTVKEKLQ